MRKSIVILVVVMAVVQLGSSVPAPAAEPSPRVNPLTQGKWTEERINGYEDFEQLNLGRNFALGDDVPENHGLAVRLFEAAFAKNPGNGIIIGGLYETDLHDPYTALKWYLRLVAVDAKAGPGEISRDQPAGPVHGTMYSGSVSCSINLFVHFSQLSGGRMQVVDFMIRCTCSKLPTNSISTGLSANSG